MENKYDKIKNYWINAGKAELDADGLKPTARDPYMQLINEYHIIRHLDSNDYVLDVGCGEGTSTLKFADVAKKVVGVDYSETLIKQANSKYKLNASFILQDILEIHNEFAKDEFDAIISIRCLINLPEKEMQYRALDNLFNVLKPGGIIFLSEGYQLGWDFLNIYRQRNNLSVINIVEYNKLFENLELEKYLKTKGVIRDFIGFGDYLFGSRVLHPILTDGLVLHDSKINEMFYKLYINNWFNQKHDNCSYAGIYIVEKY